MTSEKCRITKNACSCKDWYDSLLVSMLVDAELHEVFIPEFNGDSYLELPRLEGVGRAFSLEVWFLPWEPDGVLLYNGQLTNGKGDFISIQLINGHIQFQFDLGSGAANLT
jgi:coxsackievirus/adenovirus receptor